MALIFDERFQDRSVNEQLKYLKKLCDSQNSALDQMQNERNALLVKNRQLEYSIEQAEKAFYIQKDVVKNLFNKTNADDQETHLRIRDLERKVEELGGNIN